MLGGNIGKWSRRKEKKKGDVRLILQYRKKQSNPTFLLRSRGKWVTVWDEFKKEGGGCAMKGEKKERGLKSLAGNSGASQKSKQKEPCKIGWGKLQGATELGLVS